MHLLLNVYKILLVFPHHVKLHNTPDSISAIKTKMNGQKLINKEIDYLKGDYDDQRISDYTSSDDIMVYIAGIDSYYFLYKKYNIKDKSLYMIFDVYDYIETLIPNKTYPEPIIKYLNELLNTLNIICQKSFNIDIKKLF